MSREQLLSAILTGFTWVGGLVTFCGMLVVLLWVIDATLSRVFRAMDWMGALVRFMWLDGKKKEALRREAEQERAKREP